MIWGEPLANIKERAETSCTAQLAHHHPVGSTHMILNTLFVKFFGTSTFFCNILLKRSNLEITVVRRTMHGTSFSTKTKN